MIELTWISEARKHIGLREIKGTNTTGAKHYRIILAWLKDMGEYSMECKA